MAASWVLALRDGVTVTTNAEGECVLSDRHSGVTLRRLDPAIRAALGLLISPGASEDHLIELVRRSGRPSALAEWYYHLRHLARRGFLLFSVEADSARLATSVPIAPSFAFPSGGTLRDCRYVLSRFAYLRRAGGDMVLESPRSAARVILHDGRAAALAHALVQPGTVAELAERIPGLPAEAVVLLSSLLLHADMLQEADARGLTAEETDPALQSWEFHDLLFHTRSREGRHDALVGAWYPLADQFDPPPVVKPVMTAEFVELYRPDLERLQREDPPFAQVQERRRSVRAYGDPPLTARQLGEFLYRVARVKERREVEVETPHGPRRLEITSRPYPAGGALYELELYPVVRCCAGLTPGLYHYDPLHHRLERLSGPSPPVEQLWQDAGLSTGVPPESLQALFILAARWQRLTWKYSGLAYALTLKHVGVLYQTMYLAATAMELAPCAVGAGNSDLFARALGSDSHTEVSVGEFLLGSKQKRD